MTATVAAAEPRCIAFTTLSPLAHETHDDLFAGRPLGLLATVNEQGALLGRLVDGGGREGGT